MKKNNFLNFNKSFVPYNYIWVKEKPISFITESFHKFLANLEYVNVDNKFNIIQVTSSLSGEGKSTFISNVAYLLKQKGHNTVLIDLDLRKPKIHRIYDVENDIGITDILTNRVTIEKAIKHKKNLGFDVITSGSKTNAVANLLESKKIRGLIQELKKKYDYILIDSPPVINVSDALYISKFSDALVFVVAQEQVKRGVIKEAINLLKQNKVNILGLVLNKIEMKKNRYGYGYSYGYGYEYSYEED